jgi:hypothetical protein
MYIFVHLTVSLYVDFKLYFTTLRGAVPSSFCYVRRDKGLMSVLISLEMGDSSESTNPYFPLRRSVPSLTELIKPGTR